MAQQGPGGEKTEDATPKRRQDARKKGQAAKSTDLVSSISLLVCAMILPWLAGTSFEMLFTAFRSIQTLIPADLTDQTVIAYIGKIGLPLGGVALVMMIALMTIGIAANLGQVGLLFASEPLKPTFQKINPLEGVKRLFSKRAFFEGAKAIFKMVVFGWIVYAAVSADWNMLIALAGVPPQVAAAEVGDLVQTIMFRIGGVWLALAALDYFFQRKEFENQIKMTKQELKQEMKEQEGAPEVKMARMRQRRKLVQGGLKSRLKTADVVVTNPTHFAVALSYDRSKNHAPIVVAKGQDYLALKIREEAGKMGIPLVENRPLARALYRDCEVGDPVPRDLFAPVAEVLAYVYRTFKRAKAA